MDENPWTLQSEAEGTEDVVLEVSYCILSFNHPSFSTAFPFMGLLDLIPANFGQELGVHPDRSRHHLFRRPTLMADVHTTKSPKMLHMKLSCFLSQIPNAEPGCLYLLETFK